jgi:hypothetical protein
MSQRHVALRLGYMVEPANFYREGLIAVENEFLVAHCGLVHRDLRAHFARPSSMSVD